MPPYYDHPAYLDAVIAVIRDELARLTGTPEHYLLSFHGIPIRYAHRGDPYATHVKRTTAGLIERLDWPRGSGPDLPVAVRPRGMAEAVHGGNVGAAGETGVQDVFVATPGFTTDCLETIDEIGYEARRRFSMPAAGVAPLSLSERPSGLDRGHANAGARGRAGLVVRRR